MAADSLSQFFTSFQTNFVDLFKSNAVSGLQAAFQNFDPATLSIPTGGFTSNSITLDDANGDRIVVKGTNFTLTTSSLLTLETELQAGVPTFSAGLTDAMNAINGNGNATFSSLTISRSGSAVAQLALTSSALTITSGSDTLTVNGSFPTSLSFLSTTYNDLFTGNGALVTSLNSTALAFLSKYGLTSISASNGTTSETLTFSSTGATFTGNGYTLQLSGVLPTNLGQVLSTAVEMVQASKTGASSVTTGFTLTSASLVDTAGQTIGSINFGGLDVGSLLGGIPSSVQLNFTDTAAGLSSDLNAVSSLTNAADHVGAINLVDPSNPIRLTLPEYLNDAALLPKIAGPHTVEVELPLAYNSSYAAVYHNSSLPGVDVPGGSGTLEIVDTANSNAVVSVLPFAGSFKNGQTFALSPDPAGGTSLTITDTGDTVPPTVTGVTATVSLKGLNAGKTVTISLAMSEAVKVTGKPTLALNDGGTATYDAAKSTAKSLVFDYSVTAGRNTAGLTVTKVTLPTGASITDLAGNALAATLPSSAALGSLMLSDTAANLQALTAKQIQGLPAIGIAGLVSTNASLKFTVAQTLALETAGLSAHAAVVGGTVTVLDTGAAIATLSTAAIGALTAAGVSGITSTSGGVSLSVAQAVALESVAKITVPTGSKVTVLDTAAHILGLTQTQISPLSGTGVSAIQASDAAPVAFTVSQVLGLESAKVHVTAKTGYAVTVSDTAAQIQTLTTTNIAGFTGAGVSALKATDTGVTLTVGQAQALESAKVRLSVPAGGTVSVADTAAHIQGFSAAQIGGLGTLHVTQIAASDANVTLTVAKAQALESAKVSLSIPAGDTVSIVDTAAHIKTLTAAQIASLGTLNVTQIAASDAGVSLTAAQAAALETAQILVSAPSGSQVTLSDTAAHLQALTTGAIQGLAEIGVTSLYANNANVTFTAAQTSDLLASGLTVSAAETHTVTETFTNGVTIAVASNGARGTLRLGGNDVTVTSGPSQLSVTAGTETLPLIDHSFEKFIATGTTNEAFVFDPHFGNDAITGFAASGAGHDVLQFTAGSFGNAQANDLTALLANTKDTAGGALITDSYGDTVTLTGVTKATLMANPGDFKFTSGTA